MKTFVVYHPEKGYLSSNDNYRDNINFAYSFTRDKAEKKAKFNDGEVKQIFHPNPNETPDAIWDSEAATETKPTIPTVIIPEGFEDSTWHNNACPSMTNEELNLTIWVDWNNPNHREMPDHPQFGLTNGIQAQYESFAATDDYDEILSKLEEVRKATELANKFSEVLREWLTDEEMQQVIKRNEKELVSDKPYSICHTHDFCDANEAMLEAMDRLDIDWIFADEDREAKEKQTDLLNLAWGRAKVHCFMQIKEENFPNYK